LFILVLYSCPIQNDRTETYLSAIKNNVSPALQMVVTILTTNRKDRYDAIKKLCCLEKPGIKYNKWEYFIMSQSSLQAAFSTLWQEQSRWAKSQKMSQQARALHK